MASNIPVIVQGNSFSLAIPLQIYYINGDQMDLEDYIPDPTDEISIQLKGERRQYTYTPTVDGNICNIDLSGNELAGNYSVVVSIVKASGQRLRSFRTDQFFIVESSDDLTPADIIEGLEENVIYLNSSIFVAGEDGRGIESIVKTGTSGLVDTYTITYSDNTTSTFNVTNGAAGEAGATIASVEKTATVGKVDTYTITMTDGNTFDFEVTNGLDGVDLGLANIVNDLITGGSTNVLSAEMGKVLGDEVMHRKEFITSSLTWTRSKAIDSVVDSATFGQEKTASNSYAVCGYVDCRGYTHIQTKGIIVTSTYKFAGLVFYDSDMNPIFGYNFQGSSAGNYNKTLAIPNGAVYFRTTYWYGNIDTFEASLLRQSFAETSANVEKLRDLSIDLNNLNWNSGKYVDAVSTSSDFGKMVSANNYSAHDYVLCGDYAYLTVRMYVVVSTNSGLVFYDEDFAPLVGYNLRAAAGSLTIKTFPIPANAKYFRNSFYTASISTYAATLVSKYDFSLLEGNVKNINDVLELPPSDKCTGIYIGNKILLDTHPFGFESYFTASKSGSTARQGAACYGETLFTFHNTNDTVEVYNMRTKTRTQVISPSGGSSAIHCNTANFSKQFYNASDPFPLLYLSNQAIEVWRITGTEGNYAMSLVQTISDGESGIDIYIAEDGTFWQIGWDGGATWDTNPNGLGYARFRQYPIPSISQSEATFSRDTFIKEIRATWRYSLQGSFIKGNKLYFLWGGAGNSGIDVIDLGSGGALSSISLNGNGFTDEPEAVFEYDGALYITAYGSQDVFRLYT